MTSTDATLRPLRFRRVARRSTPSVSGMASALAFLRYELRRHLPVLALSFLLLGVLPFARRLLVGDWNYWDGSWNVVGATIALFGIAPLITLGLSASGWARERSLHLLEWLYARPLSSRVVFMLRTFAIAVPVALWSFLAVAVNRVRWNEVDDLLTFVPGLRPMGAHLPGNALILVFVQLGLALGVGLLSSALAPSVEWAIRGAIVSFLVVMGTALAAPRFVGPTALLRTASSNGFSSYLDVVVMSFLATVALVLLVAAWRAMAVAPDGPGRGRRVLLPGVLAACSALGLLITALHVPLLAGSPGPDSTWLGEEAWLSFGEARGVNGFSVIDPGVQIAHPIVTADGVVTVARDVYTHQYPSSPVDSNEWPNPAHGSVMLRGFRGDDLDLAWFAISRTGAVRQVPLPPYGTFQPIGWSPSGERFAWKWLPEGDNSPAKRATPRVQQAIVVFNDDVEVLPLELGRSNLAIVWLSDRRLLATQKEPGWWRVVDIEAKTLGDRHELPENAKLAAPALEMPWLGYSSLPTLAGEPVAFVTDADLHPWRPASDERSPMLLRFDASPASNEQGVVVPPNSVASSLGTLEDGGLVWAVPERDPQWPGWKSAKTTQIFRLRAFDDRPEPVCTIASGTLLTFLGQTGSWLAWSTPNMFSSTDQGTWGCDVTTGASRRLTEWESWLRGPRTRRLDKEETWLRGLPTIDHRGLKTPNGWLPLAG